MVKLMWQADLHVVAKFVADRQRWLEEMYSFLFPLKLLPGWHQGHAPNSLARAVPTKFRSAHTAYVATMADCASSVRRESGS